MKHLKKFQSFNEDIDLSSNINDSIEIKLTKDNLNKLKKDISDFKSKKSSIDQAYLSIQKDDELNNKVKQLIGDKNDNQFISEYLHIANLKRKVEKTQTDITKDKLSKDNFQEELKLSTDVSTKNAINIKLSDINNRISKKTSGISVIIKEISDSEKKLQDKMSKIEKEMTDYLNKITSNS